MPGTLTPAEIGAAAFEQAHGYRVKYGRTASTARHKAHEYGARCREQITTAITLNAIGEPHTPENIARFERDADMFARMAHRAWLALRVMTGDE